MFSPICFTIFSTFFFQFDETVERENKIIFVQNIFFSVCQLKMKSLSIFDKKKRRFRIRDWRNYWWIFHTRFINRCYYGGCSSYYCGLHLYRKSDDSDLLRIEEMKADIKYLQSHGVLVKLAIGGEEYGNTNFYIKVCIKFSHFFSKSVHFSKSIIFHVIEQPNFPIPNPQYFVYLLDQTVERDILQFIYWNHTTLSPF